MNRFTSFHLLSVLILFGALLLSVVLIFEFRQNSALIESQREVLEDSIHKALYEKIRQLRSGYPLSEVEIKQNWNKLNGDFYWIDSGKQVYPFLFEGDTSNTLDDKQGESSTFESLRNNSDSSDDVYLRERINIIEAFREAALGDKYALKHSLAAFLEHKLAYNLAPIEELETTIAFIQEDKGNLLPPALSESLLIHGWNTKQGFIRACLHLLLLDNRSLTLAEFDRVSRSLIDLLESLNFDSGSVEKLIRLAKEPLEIQVPTSIGTWLIGDGWIAISQSENTWLLLPANLAYLQAEVQGDLAFKGLIEPEDKITLMHSELPIKFDQVQVKLDASKHRVQILQQWLFVIVKLALLTCLTFLAVFSLRSIHIRAEKEKRFVELREEFVSMVSHELKTPLASIRLMAETLNLRLSKAMSPKDYPLRIVNDCSKLNDLVENLLSFQALKSGSVSIELSSVSFNVMMQGIVEEVKNYSQKPLVVEICVGVDQALQIDLTLFPLVLKNILLNACKYCTEDTAKVRVACRSEQGLIEISDNGIGIVEDNWELVFSDFYRVKAQSREAGTGLGLALCYSIMRSHGGSIKIGASSVRGTIWQLALPVNSFSGSIANV